jgi:hypothetical protein
MLENIRKYSAFMAVVLAVCAFGIVFVGNGYQGGSTGSQVIVAVDDSGLNYRQLSKRLAMSPRDMWGNFGFKSTKIRDVARYLDSVNLPGVMDETERVGLIMLLAENEARELGLFVSLDDAVKHVEDVLFKDKDGNFEQNTYNNFINYLETKLKIKETDFHSLVASYLTIAKVIEVKTFTNIPFELRNKERDLGNQYIDADIVKFESKSFKGKIEPTEEEIRAFYEKEKIEAAYGEKYFFTPRKIKFTFIPINLKAIPKADETTPEVTVVTMQADQERDFNAYREFLRDEENVGSNPDIVALTKKYQLNSITTELSSIDELSKYFENYDLVGDLESRGKVHSYLLSPDVPKSRRLQVNVEGSYKPSYIHYRIDEISEPQLKSYEDSREDAKMLLMKQLEAEAAEKAAKEAREKLIKAKDEGKDLRGIVATLGGIVISEPKFTVTSNNEGLTHSYELFSKGSILALGEISDIVSDDESSAFILVHKRMLEKDEEDYKKDLAFTDEKVINPMVGFGEWVSQEFEIRNVKFSKAE